MSWYTTFSGLLIFVPWPIAATLTTASQALLLLLTLQLPPGRYVARPFLFSTVLIALVAILTFSVFFSYLAFYKLSETPRLRHARFDSLALVAVDFVTSAQMARAEHLRQLQRDLRAVEANHLNAIAGRVEGVDVGRREGPISMVFRLETDALRSRIAQVASDVVQDELRELLALAASRRHTHTTSDDAYQALRDALSSAIVTVSSFTARNQLAPIPLPAFPSRAGLQQGARYRDVPGDRVCHSVVVGTVRPSNHDFLTVERWIPFDVVSEDTARVIAFDLTIPETHDKERQERLLAAAMAARFATNHRDVVGSIRVSQ